jgi:hypothetical protein
MDKDAVKVSSIGNLSFDVLDYDLFYFIFIEFE